MTDHPTTELEVYREPARPSTFEIMPNAITLAAQVAGTEFVPKSLRGRPEAVVAAILQGHELGLEPMVSLNRVHVIEGRPTLAAELMRALVQRAGHEIWLEEATNTRVTMGGRRRGEEHATRITWTLDDAKRARLDRKDNWAKYPRAMLIARATGELCRLLFADVMAGLSYTTEEVRDGFELEEAEAELENAGADLGARPDDVPEAPPETTKRSASTSSASSSSTSASQEGRPRGRRAAPPAPPSPEPELEPTSAPTRVEGGDHSAGDTIPGPSSSSGALSPAQALAARSTKIGLSEEQRHGLIESYTAGRTGSGKDLAPAEVRAIFGLLDGLEAGEYALEDTGEAWLVRLVEDGSTICSSDEAPIADEDGATGGPQSSGDAETPDSSSEPETDGPESHESGPNLASEPPEHADEALEVEVPADEEGWRAFGRAHGLKVADTIRAAAALGGDPRSAPKSLAELAENAELGAKVVAWAKGQEAGR